MFHSWINCYNAICVIYNFCSKCSNNFDALCVILAPKVCVCCFTLQDVLLIKHPRLNLVPWVCLQKGEFKVFYTESKKQNIILCFVERRLH